MNAVGEVHKSTLSSGKIVALAAGLSVGATVGYIIYRQISSANSSQGLNVEVSKMTLPVESYRNISRYQAKFLEMVSQKSGAHVRVLSDSGEPGTKAAVSFLLRGSKEQVLLARCILENLVTESEPVTVDIEVPKMAFGRIIGRGGETMKLITRTTGAKVSCSKEKTHGPGTKGKVIITGTKEEVKQAKELIIEKVKEEKMVRTKILKLSALRQKRGHIVVNQRPDCRETDALLGLNNNGPYSQTEKNWLVHACENTEEPENISNIMEEEKINTEKERGGMNISIKSLPEVSKFEIPSPDLSFQPDEHLEVYVSALENPNHFWIQILGVRSLQLDNLTEEMNRFYTSGNPAVTIYPAVSLYLMSLLTQIKRKRKFNMQETIYNTQFVTIPVVVFSRSTGWRPLWWETLLLLHSETMAHGIGPGCWESWALDSWTFTMWILGTTGNYPETPSAV
ncbi:tudor and KH domain-containing protein isoform X2 [Channa argus]|uniref:tudor and KH domain-containing protein isoform X2 n=1 Tax=Channa argus TaxID=215402 RepID=UPI0035226AF6